MRVIELDPNHTTALVHLMALDAARGTLAAATHWHQRARGTATPTAVERLIAHTRPEPAQP